MFWIRVGSSNSAELLLLDGRLLSEQEENDTGVSALFHCLSYAMKELFAFVVIKTFLLFYYTGGLTHTQTQRINVAWFGD